MNIKELILKALKAKENAYAPYSGFKVGAAVKTSTGSIYTGTNIENASYGASICAERNAIYKAISEGDRRLEIVAVVGDNNDYIFPCGICRQVIAEFGNHIQIIAAKNENDYKVYSILELAPDIFSIKPYLEKKE